MDSNGEKREGTQLVQTKRLADRNLQGKKMGITTTFITDDKSPLGLASQHIAVCGVWTSSPVEYCCIEYYHTVDNWPICLTPDA